MDNATIPDMLHEFCGGKALKGFEEGAGTPGVVTAAYR
jgi:hypothetical protein